MSVLSVKELSASYLKNKVLDDVNFEIEPGTLTAIVGPNGAGKSTLLKVILELHPKLSGTVSFFETTYKKARSRIGYVPQRGSVDWDFPTNALDVVLMGLYGQIGWLKWPKRSHRDMAMNALEKMGMADYAKRQISQLSRRAAAACVFSSRACPGCGTVFSGRTSGRCRCCYRKSHYGYIENLEKQGENRHGRSP